MTCKDYKPRTVAMHDEKSTPMTVCENCGGLPHTDWGERISTENMTQVEIIKKLRSWTGFGLQQCKSLCFAYDFNLSEAYNNRWKPIPMKRPRKRPTKDEVYIVLRKFGKGKNSDQLYHQLCKVFGCE